MTTKFYGKDIPEAPVYVRGTPLKFEVLETGDAVLIQELDRCIREGRGGVFEITKDQYDEGVKKKQPANGSVFNLSNKPQRRELSSLHNPVVAVDDVRARIESVFAKPQMTGREHTPHNRPGLPSGNGPAQMPDPIEVPDVGSMKPQKPPTAKLVP